MNLLNSLNEKQKEAATHIDGALLILAGAGTGKTKTLTTRLAYLIDAVGIDPAQTLTLTFTNKAASEMRTRAMSLIQNNIAHPPLLCTFHKFGLQFLSLYIKYLNRENNFSLIDSSDKKRILRGFKPDMAISDLDGAISSMKNQIITPSDAISEATSAYDRERANIYARYENYLLANNLVDFDDLILLPYIILAKNPTLANEISNQYNYIMVDEYQDTNALQFQLLKKLCTAHENLCVVGDDDQSIYGWRGADIENILTFKNKFKNTKIVRLEENYRSTYQILNAANTLIAHNKNRLGKVLESTKGNGEEIEILKSEDEVYEAQKIAEKIKMLTRDGVDPNEIAILFRINALSRGIEDGLLQYGIAYSLLGTVRFYERAEIKDIICYLRFIQNMDDDFSLMRIINLPKRGIGEIKLNKISKIAQNHKKSIFNCFKEGLLHPELSAKNILELNNFFNFCSDLAHLLDSPLQLLSRLINKIDFAKEYTKDQEDRQKNIDELVGKYKEFFYKNSELSLSDFISSLPLESDLDNNNDGIKCMSVHTSKGLEFDYVFVMGLEDDIFPVNVYSGEIEEERRLAYVAYTRARKKLFLSCASSRLRNGERKNFRPSCFISEAGLATEAEQRERKIYENVRENYRKKRIRVEHKVFGQGVIIQEHEGFYTINFNGQIRKIKSSFVELI